MSAIATARSTPGRLDIEAWRGDEFLLGFVVVERRLGVRTPLDLSGALPTMQVRRSEQDAVERTFDFDSAASQLDVGRVVIRAGGDAMGHLRGSYLYDVQVEMQGQRRTLLAGGFYVHGEITRAKP